MLLHLVGVVLWVGGMGFGVMVLRPSLAALEPPARLGLMGQVHGKFFRMVWVLMPLVILSGYMLLFGVYGGFAGVHWPIHVHHGRHFHHHLVRPLCRPQARPGGGRYGPRRPLQ
ncbi:MAG: hypothetical protein EBY30_15385 [Rhodospirillales bacterium]|nr:hypothetical protein [Rhodospirillales bacterium]